MKKGIVGTLLVLFSFLVQSQYEVRINGYDQKGNKNQSALIEFANKALPGFGAVCVVGSLIKSWFGGKEKSQKNHTQQHINLPQQDYFDYYQQQLRYGFAQSYPQYHPQNTCPSYVQPAVVQPAHPYEKQQQHLQKLVDQQVAGLAVHEEEWTYELHDYEIANHHYDRLQRRKEALRSFKQVPRYNEQNYVLSDQAVRLLHEKKFAISEYQTCYGNQLQQVLHAEAVTIITQASDLYYANKSLQELSLTELLIDFTDLGRECNQSGHILKALTTLDACWHLLDYVYAVAEGVVQGAWNTAKELSDPIGFAKNIVTGTAALAYHIAAVAVEVGDIGLTFCYDTQQAWGKFEKACAKIDAVYQGIQKKVQETQTRDLIKEGTSFATEFYLSGKALTALGSFYGKAQEHARRLVHLVNEGIKDWSHVVTTPEGFTMRIADKTATFLKMSAETIGEQGTRIIEKLAIVPSNVRAMINLDKRVARLRKMFDGKKITLRMIGEVTITIDYAHIWNIVIKPIYQKGKMIDQRINGFHHDFMGRLEAAGIVVKEIIKHGISGAYEARIKIDGRWFKPKTFFSRAWDDEKIINKILESLTNVVDGPKMQSNGRWSIIGVTAEGLKIQTIMESSGKIITAYPIII